MKSLLTCCCMAIDVGTQGCVCSSEPAAKIGEGRDLQFLPDTADLLQVSADLADRSRSSKPWGSQIN